MLQRSYRLILALLVIFFIFAIDIHTVKSDSDSFYVWDKWPGCKDVFLDYIEEGN
jgi:hypothetical protein